MDRRSERGPNRVEGVTPGSPFLDPHGWGAGLKLAGGNLRILFAGGGTGGHLYPALALANLLQARHGAECLFVGTDREVETSILQQSGYRHEVIDAVTGAEMRSKPLRSCWRLFRAVRSARKLLKEFGPHAVVGCGGYSSAPAVLAARTPRVPIVLLEQNVVPGETTSLEARFANAVCVPCETTLSLLPRSARCVVTGNPVRKEIALLSRQPIENVVSRRTLLVLGGSQGSSALNRAVIEAFQRAKPTGWDVLHQTGSTEADFVRSEYARLGIEAEVRPFIDDMQSAYLRAGLVVSRAGGTTLAELACAHLPAIVVPIADAVRNHQQLNGEWYAERGLVILVDESRPEFASRLAVAIQQSTADRTLRRTMASASACLARPAAAEEVAGVLKEVLTARQ